MEFGWGFLELLTHSPGAPTEFSEVRVPFDEEGEDAENDEPNEDAEKEPHLRC